jgi:hypothetical protein
MQEEKIENVYDEMARLFLGDVIEKLVNQPNNIEQANMMIAALDIVTYKLRIKFALRKVENDKN